MAWCLAAGLAALLLGMSPAAANICTTNVSIGRAVVQAVNLSFPGMGAVREASSAGDFGAACEALTKYYRDGNSSRWLRLHRTPARSARRNGGDADDLVDHDIFHLSGVGQVAKVPRNADGGINWYDQGPKSDPEFMNCLNRHDSFSHLISAWNATGNPIYPRYFSALVSDWVSHLPCRAGVSREGWNASGGAEPCATGTMESPWRVLESGIRPAGPWPPAFFGFQQAEEFSTSARVLMILGFSEHNAVLNGPGRLAHTPNWAIGQWAGLISSCVALPELNSCAKLIDTAFAELEDWLDKQVYPDGIETEEAFGYDMWTARSFFTSIELVHKTGFAPPKSFTQKVEQMFNYGVFVNDQEQYSPRNGDADLSKSGWYAPAVEYFQRPDWLWVHSAGAAGKPPSGDSASSMFPWGGQAIFRNHFDDPASALWMWMDVGVYGSSGHAHCSKLAITLRAFRSMFLVDSGRFQYNGHGLSETLNRQYERTTTAHNTLTFDGKQQKASPKVASAPVANNTWNFSATRDSVRGLMNLYEDLTGMVTHQRSVTYVKSPVSVNMPYIIVVDTVTTDRKRTVQASWHAHPRSNVTIYGDSNKATITGVSTSSGKPTSAMLTIVPSSTKSMGQFHWAPASVVRGQFGNTSAGIPWQGWYSASYNGNSTAPTLVYNGKISKAGSISFGWLLLPQQNRSSLLSSSLSLGTLDARGMMQATVRIGQRREAVDLDIGTPPALPKPCAAGTERICDETCRPVPLQCPAGQRIDFELVYGDDGSCDCQEFCATDWSGQIRSTRPTWNGATSLLGNNSAPSTPFRCNGEPGQRLICACVQATHFCPKIQHECKMSCDKPGLPQAIDFCVPAV